MNRVIAAVFVLLGAGCIEDIEPDVGPLTVQQCSNADTDPEVDVSFSADVVPILASAEINCVRCHTPTGETPIGLQASGFDVSTFDTLRAGGRRSGPDIVIPGSPCESILLQKIAGTAGFGARMPLGGPPFVSPEDFALISDWVAEGALEN